MTQSDTNFLSNSKIMKDSPIRVDPEVKVVIHLKDQLVVVIKGLVVTLVEDQVDETKYRELTSIDLLILLRHIIRELENLNPGFAVSLSDVVHYILNDIDSPRFDHLVTKCVNLTKGYNKGYIRSWFIPYISIVDLYRQIFAEQIVQCQTYSTWEM
jgi:hypothetical protein